jgi:hypothetical protein
VIGGVDCEWRYARHRDRRTDAVQARADCSHFPPANHVLVAIVQHHLTNTPRLCSHSSNAFRRLQAARRQHAISWAISITPRHIGAAPRRDSVDILESDARLVPRGDYRAFSSSDGLWTRACMCRMLEAAATTVRRYRDDSSILHPRSGRSFRQTSIDSILLLGCNLRQSLSFRWSSGFFMTTKCVFCFWPLIRSEFFSSKPSTIAARPGLYEDMALLSLSSVKWQIVIHAS